MQTYTVKLYIVRTLFKEGRLLLADEYSLPIVSLILSPESLEDSVRTRLPPPPDPSSAVACTPPASVTVMSLQVSSFKLSRWCASSEGLSGEETGRFMKTGEITGLAAGFLAALGVGMTKGETRESMFSTSELTECSRWG